MINDPSHDRLRLFWANFFKPFWLLHAAWTTWVVLAANPNDDLDGFRIDLWNIAQSEVRAGRPLPSPYQALQIELNWI